MRLPAPDPRTPPVRSNGGKFLRVPVSGGQDWLSNFYYDVGSYADDWIAGSYLDHGVDHKLNLDYVSFYDDIKTDLLNDDVIGWTFDPSTLAGDYLDWDTPTADALNVNIDAATVWMGANGYGGQRYTGWFYYPELYINPYQVIGPASLTGPWADYVAYTFLGTCEIQMIAPCAGTFDISIQLQGPTATGSPTPVGGRWWWPSEPAVFYEQEYQIELNGLPIVSTVTTGVPSSWSSVLQDVGAAAGDILLVRACLRFCGYWDDSPADIDPNPVLFNPQATVDRIGSEIIFKEEPI